MRRVLVRNVCFRASRRSGFISVFRLGRLESWLIGGSIFEVGTDTGVVVGDIIFVVVTERGMERNEWLGG